LVQSYERISSHRRSYTDAQSNRRSIETDFLATLAPPIVPPPSSTMLEIKDGGGEMDDVCIICRDIPKDAVHLPCCKVTVCRVCIRLWFGFD